MIYWRVLVRDNHDHDAGIKEMTNVFYWHKLWKIKITPTKLQLHVETQTRTNSTVIASLVSRDVQEVLYTGFVQTLSGDCNSCQTSAVPTFTRAPVIIIRRILGAGHAPFSQKHNIPSSVDFLMISKKRAKALVKTIH